MGVALVCPTVEVQVGPAGLDRHCCDYSRLARPGACIYRRLLASKQLSAVSILVPSDRSRRNSYDAVHVKNVLYQRTNISFFCAEICLPPQTIQEVSLLLNARLHKFIIHIHRDEASSQVPDRATII
jgi:hypothetical protein